MRTKEGASQISFIISSAPLPPPTNLEGDGEIVATRLLYHRRVLQRRVSRLDRSCNAVPAWMADDEVDEVDGAMARKGSRSCARASLMSSGGGGGQSARLDPVYGATVAVLARARAHAHEVPRRVY